ncbi:MAG TPA: LacI family DNA-binding transcriptional regulator [Chthoniobacteraceae bacterium]|nr:LacI family DNA-binding transcriptional regulator [Chthoniobacteraceae bacterium]
MARKPVHTVTQREIAQSLGIHQTTVSAILSGKGERFPEEMHRRVKEAARRLGYRPSASARALRGVRSGLIGVLHFGRSKDTESHRLHEIVSAIHRQGYGPLAMPMASRVMWLKKDEVSACTVMLDARVEGLVISGFADDFDLEQLERFREMRIPTVAVAGVKLPGIPQVAEDRAQALYDMTSHLIAQGRRRIICLHRWPTGNTGFSSTMAQAAAEGFRRAAGEHHLSAQEAIFHLHPALIHSGMNAFQAGENAIREVWESGARPEAVICYDDSWAVGVYHYCSRHGIRIPDDLAVVGFENQEIGNFLDPHLTTLSLPLKAMGTKALEWLTAAIRNPVAPRLAEEKVLLPCELVVRESCGAARA